MVDSASYHNVQINRHATSNARQGEMVFWLHEHGLRYSTNMTKAELYHLIKMHKPQYQTSAIDGLLAEHGLKIDAEETKEAVMSREENAGETHSIKNDNCFFERVEQFTCLGTTYFFK